MRNTVKSVLLAIAFMFIATPAVASFHFMQIEQVIGGVQGDDTAQAIQLRMRFAGQNLVSGAKLIAHDAAGANPVTIITFPGNVSSGAGKRILITSAQFQNTQQQPPVSSDFTMTSLIPASYLAAGRLTFESSTGTTYWSLCWGGLGYGGSTTGFTSNDTDGNFGPCVSSALNSASDQALQFGGTASAKSTTNLADYAVTGGAAVFVNNAGASNTVPVELLSFDVE